MIEWPKDCWIGIAQPLTWPFIHSHTHLSMIGMDKPDCIILDTPRSGDLAEKRTAQTKAALKMGCTHIAYLDGDMVYPKSALWDMMALIDDGADMGAIVCYRGAPPFDPLIWGESYELMKPFEDYKFGDVVDASAVGCACLLVKREVFASIEEPWFQVHEFKEGEKIIRQGEDTHFTRKCTKAGLSLKVITEYDISHLRDMYVNRDVWLMGMLMSKLGTTQRVVDLIKKLMEEEKQNG